MTRNDAPEPLADPQEIAFRRLAVGRSTGFDLIRTGQLAAYKVGRRTYVTRKAQAEFIAGREETAA